MVWTPADLAGLLLWYDPSDSTTVTEAAGLVSQLDDKSGNDFHAVQAVGSEQPQIGVEQVNGLDVITSSVGKDLIVPPSIGISGVQPRTLFGVYRKDSIGGTNTAENDALLAINRGSNTAGSRWTLRGVNDNLRIEVEGGGYNESATDVSVTSVVGVRFSGTGLQNHLLFQNGTSYNVTNSEAMNTDDSNENTLGLSLDGIFGEVVLTNTALSTEDRQYLEGYLAWKWGLQGDLSLDHPYRWDGTEFGFQRYWNPGDIQCSGGVYWFSPRYQHDDTITEAASKVSQWRDILGNKIRFEQISSSLQPTLEDAILTPGLRVLRGDLDFMTAASLSEPSAQDLHIVGFLSREINDAFVEVAQDPVDVRMLDGGRFVVTYGTVNGPGIITAETQVVRNQWELDTGRFDRFIGGSLTPVRTFVPASPPAPVGDWTQAAVFDDFTGGNALVGYMVDLVMMFGTVALDCLQRAEAYVAWTAGQESLLSVDNPYKVGLPLIEPYDKTLHIYNPDGTSYDLRWITSFVIDGGIARVSFWGDSTPRVEFDATDFQAAWAISRENDPTMVWQGALTSGDATLTIANSTWNLLHVDHWWPISGDPDTVAVALTGVPTEMDNHSAGGMEPIVRFDRATFEDAMNAFTLGI